jgi:hypothetical protein
MIQGSGWEDFRWKTQISFCWVFKKLSDLPLGKDDIYKSINNISIYIYYIYKQIIKKEPCTDHFESSIGNLPTYLDVNFLSGGNKHLNRKAFPLEVNPGNFRYRKCPMEKP